MIRNVHERLLPAPAREVGPLLDRIGGPDDPLWPTPAWFPMVLDRPAAVGSAGGHGLIRYRVTAHEPVRMVEFTFDPGLGLHGTHTLFVEPAGPSLTLLRHVVEGRPTGRMRLVWPLVVRWLHDAVLEDLLDRAESAVGPGPARPARWSPWVRLLRRAFQPRARATAVPATALLAAALDRVDWSDAHAIDCHAGMPTDPQAWADAIFRDPPGWVVAMLGARQALVGLVGIARDDGGGFDTVALAPDEVLLGTDERHLDFRASVLREPGRVVVSTVVRLHNAHGRAYFAVVKLVHPMIVRAMLSRAARRLSGCGLASGTQVRVYRDRVTAIPEACTLPVAEQPLRLAEFDELFAAALRRVTRLAPGWLRLHLDSGEQVEARTRDLLARESRCCSFFDFEVRVTAGELLVDMRVPAAHTAVLDGLAQRASAAS